MKVILAKREIKRVTYNRINSHFLEITKTLLIQTSERFLNLLVQLLEFTRDVLLALGVRRLKLHLRQFVRLIRGSIADLIVSFYSCASKENGSPLRKSYRWTQQHVVIDRNRQRNTWAYLLSCRKDSIGRTLRYRFAGGNRPTIVSS